RTTAEPEKMEGITCCSRRTAIAGTGSAASITCSSVARLRCQKHAEGPRGALLGLKPTKLCTARQTAPENPNKGRSVMRTPLRDHPLMRRGPISNWPPLWMLVYVGPFWRSYYPWRLYINLV